MKTTIFVILSAALTVLCRASEAPPSTGVAPPLLTNVRLERKKTLLMWESDSDDVTYTVQYSTREDGQWLNLPGCVKTLEKECDFSAIATDLYGATLRVCAQRNNTMSTWQQADRKVGCLHTGFCYPEMVVMASPGYLSLQMDSDQTLQDEYGGHLSYEVCYGREGETMEMICKKSGPAVRVEPLPVGVRFCVKVRFLLYDKPYGNTSTPVCRLIPQSEWQRDVSLAGTLAAVFAVLAALSVGCYCFITRYHQDIKDYIRPVTLPVVLAEFSSDESVQQTVATPCESHDLISRVEAGLQEEQEEEEDKGGSRSMPRSEQEHVTAVEGDTEMGGHRDVEGSEFNSSTPLI